MTDSTRRHPWIQRFTLALMVIFLLGCSIGSQPAQGKHKTAPSKTQRVLPSRTMAQAFPARIAFTRNDRLWIVNGYQPKAKPVRVAGKASVAEVVGWSVNGQYLAYLQNQSKEKYGEELYLWIVRADGTHPVQIGSKPIFGRVAWSPTSLTLAYQTYSKRQDNAPDALNLTSRIKGSFKIKTLLPDKSGDINDFAWFPDGSLAVAYRKTETRRL